MSRAPEHKEGGWAWVVLLAATVAQALTLGFPTCIGIFFTDLQQEFQATNSETSWFPSILTAMLHAGGEEPQQAPHSSTGRGGPHRAGGQMLCMSPQSWEGHG